MVLVKALPEIELELDKELYTLKFMYTRRRFALKHSGTELSAKAPVQSMAQRTSADDTSSAEHDERNWKI